MNPYFNQPIITKWNLARFAESLIPLINENKEKAISIATERINNFDNKYKIYWFKMMKKKIGLFGNEPNDEKIIESLLKWMFVNKADYTNTFCFLMNEKILDDKIYNNQDFINWKKQWQERLKLHNNSKEKSLEIMRSVNPLVIPRNHIVEETLNAANKDDLNPMLNLLEVLENPYQKQKTKNKYQSPGPITDEKYQTFCGT